MSKLGKRIRRLERMACDHQEELVRLRNLVMAMTVTVSLLAGGASEDPVQVDQDALLVGSQGRVVTHHVNERDA